MSWNYNQNTADGRLTDSLKTEIILAFRDFPSLWNTSLAIYKDKQKKTEDTQVLASRFRMFVDELKKLLHSLRTSMTREIKRMRENKGFVSRWKFFKDMEYLKDEIVKSIDEKHGKEWDDMEVETLIDFYKEHTFLWDHHTEQYKDRNLRDVTLNKLLDMLSGRTIEDFKSQWHSLKTIFDRENKREEGSKWSGLEPILCTSRHGSIMIRCSLLKNVKMLIFQYPLLILFKMKVMYPALNSVVKNGKKNQTK